MTDGLLPEDCRRGQMSHCSPANLQQALQQALERFEDPFLLIIGEGGEVIPLLED